MSILRRVRHDPPHGWPAARRSIMGVASLLAVSLASFAAAQNQPAKPATAGKPATVLAIEHAGCNSLLVDAKDQGLKNALAMLPDRIHELPGEIPGMDQLPMPIVDLLIRIMTQPGRLAVTYNADDQSGGAFGAGVVLSLGPTDEKTTADMHKTISEVLAKSPLGGQAKESTLYKGMLETPTPVGGLLRYGPRHAVDGWRYEVHFGTAPDPDAPFASLPAPAIPDFKPVFRARLDLAPLEPFARMFAAMAGGGAGVHHGDDDEPGNGKGDKRAGGGPPNPGKMIIERLKQAGVIGPNAVKYSFQSGHTKDGQVGFTVVEGMKKIAQARGALASPITDVDLAVIPADATVAFVAKGSVSTLANALQEAAGSAPPLEMMLDQLKQATDVDLMNDVVANLGDTICVYMSDTTGGADLCSAVAMVSLKDRAKFEATHNKIAAFASKQIQQSPAGGHVRIRDWTASGASLHTLAFPGLPVPLEITVAFQGDWLIVGATPQAALAAAQQVKAGGMGIRDNKAFAAVFPRDGRMVTSFSFIDTQRVMRGGYQYVSMMGSAVGNLARSAVNPDAANREPGLVVPTYNELREGARPIISFTYWRNDDLVTESHADRSQLVNLAGGIGAASPTFPIVGALIGAAGGAASSGGKLRGLEKKMMDQFILYR